MNYLRWTGALPLMLGLVTPACVQPQTNGETTNLGSSSSSSSSSSDGCEVGSLGCPCTRGDGCDLGLVCVAGSCEDEGGTTTTTTTSTATTGEMSTTTDDTTTTSGYDGTCDPKQGLKNPACLPDLPYCSLAGLCSDCSALVSCAKVDADAGVCDLESGFCVQCTEDQQGACGGTTPLCDLESQRCVACSEHAQCESGACDIAGGACFASDKVLYVYSDDPQNGKCTVKAGSGGTEETPYCAVNFAVTHVATLDPKTPYIVRLLAAPWTYSSVEVASAGDPLTIALMPAANPSPEPEFSGGGVSIRADGNVTLYVDNVDIVASGSSDYGKLECVGGAKLYASRVRAQGGDGPGARGYECELLSITDSALFKNGSEGIEITYGNLVLRNSFVSDNGASDAYGGGGLRVDQAVIDIEYATFFLNHSLYGLGDSIHCDGKALDGSTVRNAIIGRSEVIKTNESVVCLDLPISHSVVDGGEMQGAGNLKMAVPAINALLKGDYPIGAYRLKGMAEQETIRGVAIWKSGDPRRDFEGDLRAAIKNGDEVPGADVVAP